MGFSDLYHRHTAAKQLRRHAAVVRDIGNYDFTSKSQEELQARFLAFKGESLVVLKRAAPELFAIVREMAARVLSLRPFDVQMLGGLVLLNGQLAEMRTGEGKTLTIAAPAALIALSGKGVHVVTANPYLAKRDAETLRPLFEALGLTVGVTEPNASQSEKQAAYASDVTYGVNYEFGFDYLRDNMIRDRAHRVQRDLVFAIIDEVDSILIDEARTPLIISGQSLSNADVLVKVDDVMRTLIPAKHFIVDEKLFSAHPSEEGYTAMEAGLVAAGVLAKGQDLYRADNLHILSAVHSAVRAWSLYRKDLHYVVQDGELLVVDESTGRSMTGRRWGGGLHEALEARERINIKPESQTQAVITYQSLFALYGGLAGLTGTASTEAEEFVEMYGLQTVQIPTNRPMVRQDVSDTIYATKTEKWAALLSAVRERHEAGQPVLIGTASVSDAEYVDTLLTSANLPHNVLSARNHAQEATIIANAGTLGAITVATNMAGRGTDIMLGGHKPDAVDEQDAWRAHRDAVVAAGGLAVFGTERHDARRIDNQLRGRAGRQGDPGYSKFFLSLEDRLLRVFGENKHAQSLLKQAGNQLEGPMVDRFVSGAQKRLEAVGFDARRQLLKYDKVLADQRSAVYALRDSLLDGAAALEYVQDNVRLVTDQLLAQESERNPDLEAWDVKRIKTAFQDNLGLNVPLLKWLNEDMLESDMEEALEQMASERLAALGGESTVAWETAVRQVLFDSLDNAWSAHLSTLEELGKSVAFHAQTGANPAFVYAKLAKEHFEGFAKTFQSEAAQRLLQPVIFEPVTVATPTAPASPEDAAVAAALDLRWVTRNEPCPCGSGKRFKHCHGILS